MKTVFKHLASMALAVGALSLSHQALAIGTNVQISTDANGTYDKFSITSFDWADDQSVVIEQNYVAASGAAGAACAGDMTLNCFFGAAAGIGDPAIGSTLTFSLHAQAAINNTGGAFSNGVPNAFPIKTSDGQAFEVTAVLDIIETAEIIAIDGGTGVITIEFLSAAGTFDFFYDTVPNANQVTGDGFTDGLNVVSGVVTSSSGTFEGPNGLGDGGEGSSFIDTMITSYDPMFVDADDPDCDNPGTCLIGSTFNSTLDLDFGQAPFLGQGISCGTGDGDCIIGGDGYEYQQGIDLLLAADPTSQFSRREQIPVPGTVMLLGLGLLGLAGVRRRSRVAG
ncbi:MAG: PEP-CTERM sorting domain-containing protein [Cyanobacteria bacterium P01_F01_bin.3]